MHAVGACLGAREDLLDVADRDVARVGAVRVSAAAKVHSELKGGVIVRSHESEKENGWLPRSCCRRLCFRGNPAKRL